MKQLNQINNMIKNQFNQKSGENVMANLNVSESSTLVRYIVTEDYDDLELPNAFM